MAGQFTRRQALRAGAAAGASALAYNSLIARALAVGPQCGSLNDIEHVVILIQENRSFDHYFGTYRGVRGFGDPNALPGVFAQPGYAPAPGGLYPFHLDSFNSGECTNDINHSWAPQHAYWDNGAMDGFVREHVAVDGAVNGPLTMGYYTRKDLSFYYALADAFTVCDNYHCSVIGPTDPNRLYSMSATLGPTGAQGGPILSTSSTRLDRFGTLSWTTMPEQLSARGIEWKVYGTATGDYGDNILPYFKQYLTNPLLLLKGLNPTYPIDFELDVALGTLPPVSWVLASVLSSEHPPAPEEYGEVVAARVLRTLVNHPKTWAKTALFITHDENGGFFDHVPPPVAPPGTPGEYVTVSPLPSEAGGVAGPIGLGFRVPLLIASPFARGGFVAHDTFDHTSLLRFLETRFGAEVPNLSTWRRSVTGDLTSAFNFANVDTSVPSLPQPSLLDSRILTTSCAVGAPLSLIAETSGISSLGQLEEEIVPPYPVTINSGPPAQEPGSAPAPSGPVPCST
jgi:phospholipase C